MATPVEPNRQRECFVIAPIGDDDSPIRKRSDQVLKHIIRPVVEPRGYHAVRGDEIGNGGFITAHVLDRIMNNELVVADLTGPNANVFYELAIRHALRRPFVQLIAHDQVLPFDVQGMRTILVDLTDPDKIDRCKEQLGKAIDELEQHGEIVTPLSMALTLQELRGSASPEETGLTQILQMLPAIMEALHEVRRDVAMAGAINTPPGDDGDLRQLRSLVETLVDRGSVTGQDLRHLLDGRSSALFERWVRGLIRRVPPTDES